MADAFVDGEEQVARQQHQVLLARADRRRAQMLQQLFANALRIFQQIHRGHALVTGRQRRRRVIAASGDPFGAVDRIARQNATGLDDELLDGGAFRRGEVFVFGAERQAGRALEDARALLHFRGGGAHDVQLFFDGNIKRVALERRSPTIAIGADRR